MPENPPGEISIKDNIFTSHSGITTAFVKNYTDNPVNLSGNRLLGDVTPLRGPQDDRLFGVDISLHAKAAADIARDDADAALRHMQDLMR